MAFRIFSSLHARALFSLRLLAIKLLERNRHRKLLLVFGVVISLLLVCDRVTEWQTASSPDMLPLFRDLYSQEPWPDVESNSKILPDAMPRTVHYMWCGQKQFRFQHYLAILSAVRLLQPLKVIFHYTHLPLVDTMWYNVWFQELKQSLASLELQHLQTIYPCGSNQLLEIALHFLSQNGGFYLGENVIMTRFPADVTKRPFWFAFSNDTSHSSDATRGVLFARHGFGGAKRREYLASVLSRSSSSSCSDMRQYDESGPRDGAPCIAVDSNIYPRDIWQSSTLFAELARWIYYGKREILQVRQTNGTTIPRVAHMTWLNHDGARESTTFRFLHFLSVISALHVGGLDRVYVHGDLEPRGQWWEQLKGENVTFVPLDPPKSVFQQKLHSLSHRSDIARTQILRTYGGVYTDRDVVWVSRLPDWLLRYPTVLCPDWPRNGEWPASVNTGVLMSQAHAPWLRHFLSTLRYFLDENHAFNAVMMPYRVYERHPDTAFVDTRLQVICFRGICHPPWHKDYIRDIDDVRPPRDFDWREARAFHFTVPKPPPSLTSPAAIATGTDMYSEIGRHILKMAGREKMLNQENG